MSREMLLPELAESVVEGEIVRWLVAEGESVGKDQSVVEVMTDKVTVELPAPFAGVLEKYLAAEGDLVKVHQPIARFADGAGVSVADDAVAEPPPAAKPAASAAPATKDDGEPDDGDKLSLFKPGSGGGDITVTLRAPSRSAPAQVVATPPPAPRPSPATTTSTGQAAGRGAYGRVLAVPAARKLARELGVDVEQVLGSGPHGRVRVDDVKQHISAPTTAAAPGVPTKRALSAPARHTWPEADGVEERLPFRGIRRAIANQMVASHLQTVRTLHVDEADVTALVNLRERLKPVAARRGVKLSYLPFVMKAVAAALAEFPSLNSSLDEDKGEVVLKRYCNLGMAVATDNGLVVPVVKGVHRLSLLEIASEINRLAAAARDGALKPEDVRGGTFSITNIGSLGGLFSFPIINTPEAGILGVHQIKKRPVVMPDDSIVARSMIYLSLSFDHRLVDGAEGALFTSRVIELLETPEALFLDL